MEEGNEVLQSGRQEDQWEEIGRDVGLGKVEVSQNYRISIGREGERKEGQVHECSSRK